MTDALNLEYLRGLDLEDVAEVAPPIHPGEILREEFLAPLGLSAGAVARACGVPRTCIERVADESVGVTTDTALRLGRFFGTTPEFWLNLQRSFEIETLRREIGSEIERIIPKGRTNEGDCRGLRAP